MLLFKLINWTLRTQMQGFNVCVLPSSKPFHSIGESGAKIDLQTMEQLIQFSWLLLPRKFFLIYSFSEQVAAKRNSHRPVDKCSHMLIYTLLNYTLSSGQKPGWSYMTILEQMARAVKFHFWQVILFTADAAANFCSAKCAFFKYHIKLPKF